ncbi:trehalose-phosphatase [Croceicoccus estronivorus]|uniref:trehalose-phosphatase n=1 Tax=Croceicoccus estronivorus TaxID=1172626 RepID=UPI0008315D22|nr:trehalose-phosphatase [Croceicoccus estronivorus]OCC24849.1 trehalose-phosphatase [Croceicoccus estronivorus]
MTGTATSELPPPSLGALRENGPISLFVDFDGTLVDIAPAPDAIFVPDGFARRLERLSSDLSGRVALVSGRSLENLQEHLGSLDLARAGSHGLERVRADGSRIGERPAIFPEAVRVAVGQFATRSEGLYYEAKRLGAALHYRNAPGCEAACLAFADEQAARYELKAKRGKCVVELVPREADKGAAVCAFMAEQGFAGSRPVFIGDDVTDEDGFRAVAELGGFGIIVGGRQDTLARYRLPSPAKVHEWLDL